MERIQAIRLFVRMVDLGSFSKAAAEMGIGRPAATRQVARMEAQSGARLLRCTTHGVTPTEIGQLYCDKCKLIAHHDEETESVNSLPQTQVKGAMRLKPRLVVDLRCDGHHVNPVEQGVDLALRMGRLADSTLGSRHLGRNPWVVVAAPACLRQSGTPAEALDLQRHDALICSTVQGDARRNFSGGDGHAAAVPVRGQFWRNNLSTLLAAAREGFGIAALPRDVAEPALP